MESKGKKLPHSSWRGWRLGSGKKYDPNDPHFNPMHPPEGYPKEALEKEWGESFDGNGEEEGAKTS